MASSGFVVESFGLERHPSIVSSRSLPARLRHSLRSSRKRKKLVQENPIEPFMIEDSDGRIYTPDRTRRHHANRSRSNSYRQPTTAEKTDLEERNCITAFSDDGDQLQTFEDVNMKDMEFLSNESDQQGRILQKLF